MGGAASTLGGYAAETRGAVPALIRSLGDINPQVRATAAIDLAQINQDADLVIPALLCALKDNDASVRNDAAEALGYIGQWPEVVVPALFARIQQETNLPVLHYTTITPVGRFGTNAMP
jgi:HEAT repeat protein